MEAQRGERYIPYLLVTDPWSKGDYSRHIREASMAMDGLLEGVLPSGRVPGQLLLAAPILKLQRGWYREENGNRRSILGVSSAGTKYRPKGAPRGATGQPGGCLACPRGGRARDPSGVLVVALPSFLGDSGGFRVADFYIIFPEFLEHF